MEVSRQSGKHYTEWGNLNLEGQKLHVLSASHVAPRSVCYLGGTVQSRKPERGASGEGKKELREEESRHSDVEGGKGIRREV